MLIRPAAILLIIAGAVLFAAPTASAADGLQEPEPGQWRSRPRVAYLPGSDSDGDGVHNGRDRCAASLPEARHDSHGCMEPGQLVRLYGVTFGSGGSELDLDARNQLATIARALRQQPQLRIRVDGHTDAFGEAAANRRLGRERAEAVATWLTLQGVSPERISTRSHGESRPIESNRTADGRRRNRRIEIILLEQPELAMETTQ